MSAPVDQAAYAQYYASYYQHYGYPQQQPSTQQQDYYSQQPPLPLEDSEPPPPLPGAEEERPPLPLDTNTPVGETGEEERPDPALAIQDGSQLLPNHQPPTQPTPISSAQPLTQAPPAYSVYSADQQALSGGGYPPGMSHAGTQPTWTQSPTTESAAWQQNSSNQQVSWEQGWTANQQCYNNWGWDAWSGQWMPQSPGVGASQQQAWPYYQYNQGPVQQWPHVSAEGQQHSQEQPPRSPGTPPLPSIEPSIECNDAVGHYGPAAQVMDNGNVPSQLLSSGENSLDTPHYGSEQSQAPVPRNFPPNPSSQESEARGNHREVPGNIGRKHERSDYNRDDRVGAVKKLRQDNLLSQDKNTGITLQYQFCLFHSLNLYILSLWVRIFHFICTHTHTKVALPNSGTEVSEENTHQPSKWPPKFKGYVQRAFAAAVSDSDKEYVHRVLDEELNRMFADKKQWEIDWDSYPLPT